jgi:nucleosome binding factor SPN SPT16 subunit
MNHQDELEEKMREDALARIKACGSSTTGSAGPGETPVAYKSADTYPATSSGGVPLRGSMTMVDGKAEAVLIPVFGRLVPFHISTVKNVSINLEGGFVYLRINFIAPSVTAAANGMPKESAIKDHFIREITLKARNPTNLNSTCRLIKELRKRVMQREKQVALGGSRARRGAAAISAPRRRRATPRRGRSAASGSRTRRA